MPPTPTEPLRMTALEQAAAIRRGDLGSEELVELYLGRIATHNPQLAAFVSVLAVQARRWARRIDRRRRRGAAAPVFAGVPCGIKDVDAVRGSFMRAGSRALRWVYTPFDGLAARRVRAAGLVICGKLATSELAILPVTEPAIHPPTRNPYNPAHTAGGSSGGSAAAVAADLLPIAHASDGAGSIRIPAAFCHLYGFKPSRQLLPSFYGRTDPDTIACTGPMARSVADAAAFLDALGGYATRDPQPASLSHRLQEGPGALRVQLCVSSPLVQTTPAIAAAVRRVGHLLESLGHRVEEVDAFDVGGPEDFVPVMQRMVARVPIPFESKLQPVSRWMRRAGRRVSGQQAESLLATMRRRIAAWFGAADLALLPTVGLAPPPVGFVSQTQPEADFASIVPLGAFTAAFNVSGQPAASLPAGLDAAGLPIGVQLVGRPGGDLRVLQVSRQLEEAAPWRDLRPTAC